MISVDNTENIISFCTGYGGIENKLYFVVDSCKPFGIIRVFPKGSL